jgi:hypothetical protein
MADWQERPTVTGRWLCSRRILRVPGPGNNAWSVESGPLTTVFQSFDDRIILTNHSNIFEVSEKSDRSAHDVTRLKYP